MESLFSLFLSFFTETAFALCPPDCVGIIDGGVTGATSYDLPQITGGTVGLSIYIFESIFPFLRTLFIGIALLMFFYYAGMLLLESGEESTIKETKEAYEHAIIGAAIVAFATFIIDGFGRNAGVALINPGPINFILNQVIGYLKMIVAAVVSINLFIQGFRLIVMQGQEGEMEKQKKRFFYGLIGVAVILLAGSIVDAVVPGSNSSIISVEIVGIVDYLLVFFAVLSVIAFIVAGAMLVISVDEGIKDKAKKTMSGAVITIVIVLAAYTIVSYFLT